MPATPRSLQRNARRRGRNQTTRATRGCSVPRRGFGDSPRFLCDYGTYITIGANSFINYDAILLDCAPITIGDDVQIAPRVQLLTAAHPVDDHEARRAKWESASPSRLATMSGSEPAPLCVLGDGRSQLRHRRGQRGDPGHSGERGGRRKSVSGDPPNRVSAVVGRHRTRQTAVVASSHNPGVICDLTVRRRHIRPDGLLLRQHETCAFQRHRDQRHRLDSSRTQSGRACGYRSQDLRAKRSTDLRGCADVLCGAGRKAGYHEPTRGNFTAELERIGLD